MSKSERIEVNDIVYERDSIMNAPSTPANSTSNGQAALWSAAPSTTSFAKADSGLGRREEVEDIDISEDENEGEEKEKGFNSLKGTPV